MNYLRKLFWLMVCLCCLPAARAQVVVLSGQVISTQGQPLPYAQVRICSVTSTGVPCAPTASIYQDFGLTIPAPNPTTTDQYGNYTVYAGPLPAPNLYTVQFSPASGITWAYVYNGPGLSASGGTVTGFINALGYNGVPEADQCSGSDAFAKINTCAALLPNGGVEDARGFGATTQPTTTKMTALATPTRPIELILNPATTYQLNQTFSAGLIASNVASNTSGANGACIVPVANDSSIVTPGFVNLSANFVLGPAAATYDVVCNANQDRTQEDMMIDGLGISGNPTATMEGSLLHLVSLYSATKIEDVVTVYPFGNGVTVSGGGPYVFFNDNFLDDSYGENYVGNALTLNCLTHATFTAGSVQDNGPHNPLVIMQNCLLSDAQTPTTGIGYANSDIYFQNEYFEIEPATIGTFSGHATNVDPIQMLDPSDVHMDGLTMEGAGGGSATNQAHVFDIESSGANGQVRGPVDLENITIGPQWAGKCIVNNAIGSPYVSPNQACVYATQNGSNYGIGNYRWNGNGASQGSTIDYEDWKNFSNVQAFNTNSVINAAQEAGSDIGVKVNAAITACPATGYSGTPACTVYVPAGAYNYATTILVPLNTFSGLKLEFDKGAWLHYTGSGDGIKGYLGPGGPNVTATLIEGGSLWGDVSGLGANGIHILPGNQTTIRDMQIVDFTAGDGILLEGPNQVQIEDNVIQDNMVGIRSIPTFCTGSYPYTCSGSTSGSPFTVNALHVTGNAITNNLNLGIEDDRNGVSGGTTGTLNNTYDGNDLELNGNTCTGGGICGAIYIDKSTGSNITHNYFEGSSRQVVLGENTATNYFGCAGCNVKDNYFTIRTATPYLIEAINTFALSVEGNSSIVSTENSSNCAYNETAYSSGVSYGAQATFWGHNQIALTGGGNLFCQGGTVEQLMAGAGSYAAGNANYYPLLAYQNFAANGSVTSETVSIQYVTTESSCFATPRSTAAAGAIASVWIDTYGSGGFTLHHSATPSMDFDIFCSWKAPPE